MADLPQYKFKHIAGQTAQRQWVAQAPRNGKILLGRVVVNTGGKFRMYVYDGVTDAAPPVAYIINPSAGQTFTYDCALDHGLAYELKGSRHHSINPYSITVTYLEL